MQGMDVLNLCALVRVPTLVLSCRNDARVPFEQGAKLAAALPDARFVPLDSANHVLLPEEPAWVTFHGELAAFLGETAPAFPVPRRAGLTEAEAEVLRLLAEGLDNRSIAGRLGKSEKTVRNHVSVVLSKLGVQSRAQAIVRALRT
jgi:DNA-binding NarL/FixJ family response regulator